MDRTTIPTYSLFIHPANLRELMTDIWSDEPIPAKLTIHNKTFPINLAYRGNHIREFAKKSYLITIKKRANYRKNQEFHLNAEFLDTSLIRSKLSFDFFHDIGVFVPSARHVFLKINGKKSGIYLKIESLDQLYFEKRNIPVKAIFYAINSDADFSLYSYYEKRSKLDLLSGFECKYGTVKEGLYFREFIYKINALSDDEFTKEVENYLDVHTFLRWLAGVVCIQNFDGFHQNYAIFLNAETNLFSISPWDHEATWGRDCHGEIMEYDYVPIYGDQTNILVEKLLQNSTYRKKYKEILEEILDHHFRPEILMPKINAYVEAIQPHLEEDPYYTKSMEEFTDEIAFINQYIKDRHSYLREHLSDLT